MRQLNPDDQHIFLFEFSVLDASGHVGSGFVWGNNYWLGSKKACDFVNEPVSITLSRELPKNHRVNLTNDPSPFPVGYKLTWAKHRSQWQLDINTLEKVRSNGFGPAASLEANGFFDIIEMFYNKEIVEE